MNVPLPGFVRAGIAEPGSEAGVWKRLDGVLTPVDSWMSTRRMPGRRDFPDHSALYARLFAAAALQMDQARDERALGAWEFSTPRRRQGDRPAPPRVAD